MCVNNRKHLSKGSTIIFVLMVMLVAMIITTTITTVVVSNLRTATAYNEHAHSYYAMESGLERGLYYLQYARSERTVGATASVNTIAAFTGSFSNNASYVMAPTFVSNYTVDLATGDTAQWDLYEEDYTTTYQLQPITNLIGANITWSESSDCVPTASQVEVSFSAWTEFEWEDITDPGTLVTHYVVMGGNHSLGLDDTHLYKIRVKALNCTLEDVSVTPSTTTGSVDTTDYIELTATGDYANSVLSGSVVAPWNPALSKYFEYVLFAEDTISK